MSTGAITDHIDVAQVALYTFWLFFAGLVYYLRREDRREGYPLVSEPSGRSEVLGGVWLPKPKVFRLFHGGTDTAPRPERERSGLKMKKSEPWPGAPFVPTGNPMIDGVGPASWVERSTKPDLTVEGLTRIAPLRLANDFYLDNRDADPRGMQVVGADGVVGGIVRDIWVDRSEALIRYLEIDVTAGGLPRRVLLPMPFAQIDQARRTVKVISIMGEQFAAVPALDNPDQVTLREEDKVAAYYGGGTLYAHPSRQEPLI